MATRKQKIKTTILNKRDQAILDFFRNERKDEPEYVNFIASLFAAGDADQGLMAWIAIAFEAGRKFQSENPSLPLNDPNIYLT